MMRFDCDDSPAVLQHFDPLDKDALQVHKLSLLPLVIVYMKRTVELTSV